MSALVVAYKIEAGKGSEDGSGYEIVRSLVAAGIDLTLVSRVNNIAKLRDDPAFADATLVGLDVPAVLAFYKRGGRGIILYYYLWQIVVGRRVRRLQRSRHFDVLHQLNFHADWAPHFLPASAEAPIVWGPMAHHRRVPLDCLPHRRRLRFWVQETVREAIKQAFWRGDPNLRRAIRRSDVILYANDDPAPPFRRAASKTVLRPYAATSVPVLSTAPGPDFGVLTVGRLVPLKGLALSVEAFAGFVRERPTASARLTIVGAGPMRAELEDLCGEHGISDRVELVAWLPQAELATHYAAAHLFLYPSFEAQGLVVAEAMAAGLPVASLEGTGPSVLAGDTGWVVARGRRHAMVNELTSVIEACWAEHEAGELQDRRSRSSVRYTEVLSWQRITHDILRTYDRAIEAHRRGH